MLNICITGGPGSGKTVVIYHLMQILEEHGYHVFLAPETTQELKMNGIRPNAHITQLAFYNFALAKQLDKERLYGTLSRYYPNEKIVIVYDRGILDIGTELSRGTFEGMLQKSKMSINNVYDHYDLVFHLTTAADGAEQFYLWDNPTNLTNASNVATESPYSAKEKDIETQNAWKGHPNLHIIPSTKSFSKKINNVVNIVLNSLGLPLLPDKIRRFVIEKPSEQELAHLKYVFKGTVIHTYLHSTDPKIERSVLQRGNREDGFSFYYIERVDIDDNSEKFISEQQITQQEYSHYLSDTDNKMMPLTKTLRCFVHDNKYYEMELYAFDHQYAILDLESDINELNKLPFKPIKEVTSDPMFEDKFIATTFHLPEINTVYPTTVLHSEWMYETGREEVGFGKDDTRFFGVIVTPSEKDALSAFFERGRTYLIRYKNENGKKKYQWYDRHSRVWLDDERQS